MNLTVAIVQVGSGSSSQGNLLLAEAYTIEAAERGAELIVFPEGFMNHYPAGTPFCEMETQTLSGSFVTSMQQLASNHHVWCIFGMRETAESGDERAYNTTVVINSAGEIVTIYRKTHLYDAFGARESEKIKPGDEFSRPFDSPWGKIGLFVCYELRFPEVSRSLVGQGANILVVPSGWVRGPMKEEHWEYLVVTRALENTAFVIAADQVSDFYCGRSLIVDPMGTKLASGPEVPALVMTTLDLDRIDQVRKKLPSYCHRRPELYQILTQSALDKG